MNFTDILQANNISVESGKKSAGHISVPGTPVEMPTTVICGQKPGKNILITGGVHGGEYPCIETAIRLAGQLEPSEISGTLLIIHPVNTPAFLAECNTMGLMMGKT